jgi:hypothetical protein
MPIFLPSCSADGSACHGDPSDATSSQRRPYLGPASGTPDMSTIATILSALMKPSAEDPSMPLVTPGDATKSYLMQKMDNTQGKLNCSSGDIGTCGTLMPLGAAVLPTSTRDTVRAWINQGATNN